MPPRVTTTRANKGKGIVESSGIENRARFEPPSYEIYISKEPAQKVKIFNDLTLLREREILLEQLHIQAHQTLLRKKGWTKLCTRAGYGPVQFGSKKGQTKPKNFEHLISEIVWSKFN